VPNTKPGRASASLESVLFDLGAVLVDWNPRYLYRPVFGGDEAAMEHFLAEIVPPSWNLEIDRGKPLDEAIAERVRLHPGHADLISMWRDRWEHMLRDPIPGSVEVLADLRGRGHRLFALTNWSAETFPVARRRFEFLQWFEDIVVSGEVKLAKPDPQIFELAIRRCRLVPGKTAFIDDLPHNVEAGRKAGLHAIHFRDPQQLRADLKDFGLL
jgi:2-haloacid dehalogenase